MFTVHHLNTPAKRRIAEGIGAVHATRFGLWFRVPGWGVAFTWQPALMFIALLLLACSVFAADYKPAKVLDVQPIATGQSCQAGILAANCTTDRGTQLTIELDGLKVTGQAFAGVLGTAGLYLANHPEALLVGSEVQAVLGKGGWLSVKVSDGKVLKFKVQRMEKL